MTTITIDRAVKALEALREASLVWASPEVANAFSVLREALNAPQPQPVYQVAMLKGPANTAWVDVDEATYNSTRLLPNEYKTRQLYTAPPRREWVKLTDEQIDALAITRLGAAGSAFRGFARVIEQASKEHNT